MSFVDTESEKRTISEIRNVLDKKERRLTLEDFNGLVSVGLFNNRSTDQMKDCLITLLDRHKITLSNDDVLKDGNIQRLETLVKERREYKKTVGFNESGIASAENKDWFRSDTNKKPFERC